MSAQTEQLLHNKISRLEREIDQLDDERLSWKREAELRGEATAELRRDRERLDWLFRYCEILRWKQINQRLLSEEFDCREQIDAAIRDSQTANKD